MQSKGIIISNKSDLFTVEDIETNEIVNCRSRGKFKEKKISPLVGDFVEYSYDSSSGEEGVLEEIATRKNEIKRPKMANLTQIVLVVSMKLPKPDLLLLDKQLVFAEYNNIKPIIVLNKIDLEDDEVIDSISKTYQKIGYNVIKTVANNGEGIDRLQRYLKGNITAFSGNSGVGKSTLINSIFSGDITKEGCISEKNKRGKNTTTSTYLYKIDQNSYVADTPGFSTFDVSEISSEDLCNYFIEFADEIQNCEFVGCTHVKEQSCGIKDAVANGKISEERYNRYCKIYSELKDREAHRW